MVREIAVVAGIATALPAVAGEMTASEARQFVIGKLFSYACFDGTRGQSRVHVDGSVDGFIQFQGGGTERYSALPAASLRGSLVQPCFYLERTNADSFRGSISGMSFAYCDFTRYQGRAHVVRSERPVQLRPLSLTVDSTK